MTSDVLKDFNHDTAWLATGVLGTVVVAALVFALQEHYPTKVDPSEEASEEAIQAGSDLSVCAVDVSVGSVVSKRSNGKMASGEGNGVDHAIQ